jgi:hypothetical protein
MDTPVEGETGDEAEAEIERLEAELEGLEAIIGELKDKVRAAAEGAGGSAEGQSRNRFNVYNASARRLGIDRVTCLWITHAHVCAQHLLPGG